MLRNPDDDDDNNNKHHNPNVTQAILLAQAAGTAQKFEMRYALAYLQIVWHSSSNSIARVIVRDQHNQLI